jgi:preprotein translocase subunit SecF
MATHKKFRELVKPGTNFEFVGRTRLWAIISFLLVVGSIGMLFVNKEVRGDYLNWTIDFKGGTELIFGFRDKETNENVSVAPGKVRGLLQDAGEDGFEVTGFSWTDDDDKTVKGMLVRTPNFGAVKKADAKAAREAFHAKFEASHEVLKTAWSGDRMFARSKAPFDEAEMRAFFAEYGMDMKQWGDEAARYAAADEGTGEYNTQFAMWGLDRQFKNLLAEGLGVDVDIIQTYAVGAKAGKQLRNDGIKSLFYVMILIMLYLAFRFDIRYAPGAVAALLHDALLVTGIFAVTWTDVSLTSVAALLTVIGYSVNDTVVIFDRIRENVGRIKDKKLSRIINISLNETLSRTLLTSITLLVVTLMMNIFGTGVIRNFAFAMNIGVIVGVYSSVFVASPVLLYMQNKYYSGPAKGSGRPGPKKSGGKKPTTKKPAKKKDPEQFIADDKASMAAAESEKSEEAEAEAKAKPKAKGAKKSSAKKSGKGRNKGGKKK